MTVTENKEPQEAGQLQTPLKQNWAQPSHPTIKVLSSAVLASSSDTKAPSFTLTAVADHDIPAKTLIAKNTSTTLASAKDYSTVQVSKTEHIRLNSDLLYCNHSCGPNVRFVTSTLRLDSKDEIEGPVEGALEVWSINDIPAGEEFRFFYPSTEWEMSQPFRCSCGAEECLGWIDGAKNLPTEALKRYWLSGHIESLIAERDSPPKLN